MISNRAGKGLTGLTARLMPTKRCLASMTAIPAIGVTSVLHAAPTAKWIWHDAPEPASNAPLFFRHTLELQESVVKATLTHTAENEVIFYLNGEEVAKHDSRQRPIEVDVTELLRQGENVLRTDPDGHEWKLLLGGFLEAGGNPNASNFSGPQSE